MAYLEDILRQALSLPPADRAFVVAALERSLSSSDPSLLPHAVEPDSDEAVSGEEFLAELGRRSAAYKHGEMTARPVDEVIAELRRKFPN